MENFDINEIISIETLPKIIYQLEQFGSYIDKELQIVKNLECNEENKQEVKKVRTNINNMLTEFENKRKTIKAQILQEYEIFNEKYESEIKQKLTNASNDLKHKIDDIEKEQLIQKVDDLELFVNQYIVKYHLEDILDCNKVVLYKGLKINLSTSLSSLKKNALEFIEKVANDVEIMRLEEYGNEILLEYKNNFDYSQSKLIVFNRHIQLKKIEEKENFVDEFIKEEQKIEEKVQEILMPKEIIEENELVECNFKVKCSLEKLKELKKYMKEMEILIIND